MGKYEKRVICIMLLSIAPAIYVVANPNSVSSIAALFIIKHCNIVTAINNATPVSLLFKTQNILPPHLNNQ